MGTCTCQWDEPIDPICSVHGDQAQPIPADNGGESMHDVVLRMVEERRDFGLRKYGSPLQAWNGRDSARDVLEEVLDAAVYAAQAQIEMRAMRAALRAARPYIARAGCHAYTTIEYSNICVNCRGNKEECAQEDLLAFIDALPREVSSAPPSEAEAAVPTELG